MIVIGTTGLDTFSVAVNMFLDSQKDICTIVSVTADDAPSTIAKQQDL
jgi:hypothetical protein